MIKIMENPDYFNTEDKDLLRLNSQAFIYEFPQLKQFPYETPGIFTLSGTYQTGKTTLLKIWMKQLLSKGIKASAIIYLPCETITNYHELYQVLKKQISFLPAEPKTYFILDDVTAINHWEKAFALLLKEISLKEFIWMFSGANFSLSEQTKKTFLKTDYPINQDFKLHSLSFYETLLLKNKDTANLSALFNEFSLYLQHGGHFVAMNDIEKQGHIQDATFTNYSEWIANQILKQGKHEHFLREVFKGILHHYNSQVTWNFLAHELSIDHPKTISEYFALLSDLDIVFAQYALDENKMALAPKKARKIMFTNPFLFHAIQAWLTSTKNIDSQIQNTLSDSDMTSKIVEASVITHFRRYYPTFYIKGEGEIDLAYLEKNRFWPIETTWLNPLRAKDLKQILKYENARILTKTERSGIIEHIKTEPIPLALWQLGDTNAT